MAVEIWDGSSWVILKTYTNTYGNIPWTSEVLEYHPLFQPNFPVPVSMLPGVTAMTLITGMWIISASSVSPILICLTGYSVSLNGTLGAFTADTSYQIPPELVVYGQTNTLCVTAVYGYNVPGYSIPVCKTFTAEYLYPVNNFTGDSLECNALFSWEKPVTATGATPAGPYRIQPLQGF